MNRRLQPTPLGLPQPQARAMPPQVLTPQLCTAAEQQGRHRRTRSSPPTLLPRGRQLFPLVHRVHLLHIASLYCSQPLFSPSKPPQTAKPPREPEWPPARRSRCGRWPWSSSSRRVSAILRGSEGLAGSEAAPFTGGRARPAWLTARSSPLPLARPPAITPGPRSPAAAAARPAPNLRRLAGDDAYIPWGSDPSNAAELTTLVTQAEVARAADDSDRTWLTTRRAASDVRAGTYGWYAAGDNPGSVVG